MSTAASAGPIARGVGRTLVALRWVLLPGWVAAAVAAALFLPSLGGSGPSPLTDVVPEGSRAAAASERATELFGAPAATDVVVVQRDPRGLSARAIAAHGGSAMAGGGVEGVRGAAPFVNVPLPSIRWRETATTALSFLFVAPELNLEERKEVGEAYVRTLEPEGRRGVTGAAPARLAQFDVIQDALPRVEVATVVVILLLVFLYFRSLLAPLVALGTAAIGYVIATRSLAFIGERTDIDVPQEIEPLLVVLLLGLATDYSVFFLAEGRRRLLLGDERLEAARAATARTAPIVLSAGIIVAGCSAALLAGKLEFFRVFGPGLAICAVVVTVVSVTLVPALLGICGGRLFSRAVRQRPAATAQAGDRATIASPSPPGVSDAQRERLRRRLAGLLGAVRVARRRARAEGRSPTTAIAGRLMASRGVSVLVAVASVAGLGLAAREALSLDLGVSYVRALPSSTETRSAGDAAMRGFAPGVLAPTEVVVEQPGVGDRRAQLVEVQDVIGAREGLGPVLGPKQQSDALPPFLVAEDEDAARFILLHTGDPTAAQAIGTIRALRDDLPAILAEAGLPPSARISVGGEAALAAETVEAVTDDLLRVGIAVAVVTLVLLAVFLRSLLAPVALLFASALGFVAALGLTALAVDLFLGQRELTYYVPLVGLVLLTALGSDYNVFITGRIRAEARARRLREAIAVAVPQASRAITVAGITLAGTFALLGLVPLRPFRELAILLAVGILVDVLVVRPLLIPALISLLGRTVWWPGRPIRAIPEARFVARVGRLSDTGEDEAAKMARVTLRTLGERIGRAQARELGDHLPAGLRSALVGGEMGSPFGYDEFIRRVAERGGVDRPTAGRDAAAVMVALLELVPPDELEYVRAALSEDYRSLLGDVAPGGSGGPPAGIRT